MSIFPEEATLEQRELAVLERADEVFAQIPDVCRACDKVAHHEKYIQWGRDVLSGIRTINHLYPRGEVIADTEDSVDALDQLVKSCMNFKTKGA